MDNSSSDGRRVCSLYEVIKKVRFFGMCCFGGPTFEECPYRRESTESIKPTAERHRNKVVDPKGQPLLSEIELLRN